MECNYTKGEWEIKCHIDAGHPALAIHPNLITIDAKGIRVCRIEEGNQEANARLISASPDLYEALEYVLNVHNPEPWSIKDRERINKARQALSKAKG